MRRIVVAVLLLFILVTPIYGGGNTVGFAIEYDEWKGLSRAEKLWTTFVFGACTTPSLVEWQQDHGCYEVCPLLPDHPTDLQMVLYAVADMVGFHILRQMYPKHEEALMWLANGTIYWGWIYDQHHDCLRFNQDWRITIYFKR